MRIKPVQILQPNVGKVSSMRDFALQVKDEFRDYLNAGVYQKTASPAVLIYTLKNQYQSHKGIIALNDIRDFELGKIKKHEKTLLKREQEYSSLLRDWKAVIKPVLLTFPPNVALTNWMAAHSDHIPPDFEVSIPEDGETHTFWQVTDQAAIAAVIAIFDQIPAAYIADGHHRTTSMAHFARLSAVERDNLDFDYLFSAFFPDDQLRIMGYHRIVNLKDPDQVNIFAAQILSHFPCSALPEIRLPLHKREVIMVFNGKNYAITLTEDAPLVLDASLLNELFFTQLLGVSDVRSDKRITYLDGAAGTTGMLEATNAQPNKIGFLLFPVSFSDLYQLSDQGIALPPKSTWFEPRIRSGLAVHSLEY